MCLWMCLYKLHRSHLWNSKGASDHLQLEFKDAVSHLKWVLETEVGFPKREVCVFYHQDI